MGWTQRKPFHESAGLVWQAWRPGDRLGTKTKAKATGTQAEKGGTLLVPEAGAATDPRAILGKQVDYIPRPRWA